MYWRRGEERGGVGGSGKMGGVGGEGLEGWMGGFGHEGFQQLRRPDSLKCQLQDVTAKASLLSYSSESLRHR